MKSSVCVSARSCSSVQATRSSPPPTATPAWSCSQPQPVDAVVLDYAMPGMHGGEVAKKMRQTKPDVPILLLSAYVGLPDEVSSLVDVYMTKGEGAPALLEKLGNLLSLYEAHLTNINREKQRSGWYPEERRNGLELKRFQTDPPAGHDSPGRRLSYARRRPRLADPGTSDCHRRPDRTIRPENLPGTIDRNAHVVDEETGLRGYQVTSDSAFPSALSRRRTPHAARRRPAPIDLRTRREGHSRSIRPGTRRLAPALRRTHHRHHRGRRSGQRRRPQPHRQGQDRRHALLPRPDRYHLRTAQRRAQQRMASPDPRCAHVVLVALALASLASLIGLFTQKRLESVSAAVPGNRSTSSASAPRSSSTPSRICAPLSPPSVMESSPATPTEKS
jgi:CheY-like chemotaxis protein